MAQVKNDSLKSSKFRRTVSTKVDEDEEEFEFVDGDDDEADVAEPPLPANMIVQPETISGRRLDRTLSSGKVLLQISNFYHFVHIRLPKYASSI